MKTPLEETKAIVELLREHSQDSYKNLESINTGSNHKEKDDIVTSVCQQARKARRTNSTLHHCLDYVLNGYTISDFYNMKLESATRTNQCEQDRLDTMEELEIFTHLIIDVDSDESSY